MNDPALQVQGDPGEVRFTLVVTRKTGQVETYDFVGTIPPPEDPSHGCDPHRSGT